VLGFGAFLCLVIAKDTRCHLAHFALIAAKQCVLNDCGAVNAAGITKRNSLTRCSENYRYRRLFIIDDKKVTDSEFAWVKVLGVGLDFWRDLGGCHIEASISSVAMHSAKAFSDTNRLRPILKLRSFPALISLWIVGFETRKIAWVSFIV